MTAEEWLACDDPVPLFQLLNGKTTERKLRLFAVASLQFAVESFESSYRLDVEKRRGLDVAERFAEGQATIRELRSCWPALQAGNPAVSPEYAFEWAETIVMARSRGYYGGGFPVLNQPMLCRLIRDIIGDPVHATAREPSWLTWTGGTIPRLAEAIYHDGGFTQLSILADALEEAGCEDAEILNHCRGPGPHVRGCWVLDMLLGKE